jgi:hypothetical protein
MGAQSLPILKKIEKILLIGEGSSHMNLGGFVQIGIAVLLTPLNRPGARCHAEYFFDMQLLRMWLRSLPHGEG